jgi:hypothetical protein
MSEQRPTRDTMSIEEATISYMWEIAAIVEVFERKSLCTKPTNTKPTARGQNVSGSGTRTISLVSKFKEPVCPCVNGMEIDAMPVFVSPEAFRLPLICSKLAPSAMPPVWSGLVNCTLADVIEEHSPEIGPWSWI